MKEYASAYPAGSPPDGTPWSERKAYVWWDPDLGEAGEWTGHDVPDFEKTKPPSYRPPEDATGVAALAGDDAFIMNGDGKGALFVPQGLIDGPLPTHYEPVESPFRNAFYAQQANPTRKEYVRPDNPINPSPPVAEDEVAVFPYGIVYYVRGGDLVVLAYAHERRRPFYWRERTR